MTASGIVAATPGSTYSLTPFRSITSSPGLVGQLDLELQAPSQAPRCPHAYSASLGRHAREVERPSHYLYGLVGYLDPHDRHDAPTTPILRRG